MHLLLTRPEPDATAMKTALEAMGHEITLEPLLAIDFSNAEAIDLDGAQAVIATSRNGLRALQQSSAFDQALALPLFVVGQGTEELAQEMGFAAIHRGPGDAAALVPVIAAALSADAGRLVHPAGAVLSGDLASPLRQAGFEVSQPVVYHARNAERLSAEARLLLQGGCIEGVILMSPRTAACYSRLIAQNNLAAQVGSLRYYCLSPAVAEHLAPLGDLQVDIATRPDADEMLALIGQSRSNSR